MNQSPSSPRIMRQPSQNNTSLTPAVQDSNMRSPSSPIMAPMQRNMSESLRGNSPRTQRQPSLSQSALQELLNHPPLAHQTDNKFGGRDWRKVAVGEIVDTGEVHWVESDTSVEAATNYLIETGAPNVVLVRSDQSSHTAINTFDYGDLNAYLLLVVGILHADESHNSTLFHEIARKGRSGQSIPLQDFQELHVKQPFVTLSHTANLTHAVEAFGSGIHRILILREGTSDVMGVLTQLRLVRFFWQNGKDFAPINDIYQSSLQDLNLGSRAVVSINGDKPVVDALEIMYKQSITSLPVLDNQRNVVGNISQVDTRLLTKSTSLPLLRSSCIHFISVILSERGRDNGQDSVPVFYISPSSTLAHTVAKLVATRSHRMWIVDSPDSPSPASSIPSTPALAHNTFGTVSATLAHMPASPTTTSVPASALPGQNMSGHLSGVVSLTDILNVFARASGLSPQDPDDARRRRRSSSSSLRASMESVRSFDSGRAGGVSRR